MNDFISNRPGSQDISWCPGCGNFAIRTILIEVLSELNLDPADVVLVSGIGQAAKMPHYVHANGFHTLHGRAVPIATGVKTANPELTVIAEGGDGDMYAEGGNHFIHGLRRNADITLLVHNNQVYGLTKGQASPTTMIGMKTPTQPEGVFEEPFNPLALAIASNAAFVARACSGHVDKTREVLRRAIQHRGFSLVDIFQPCVSFNKLNTYDWYEQNTCWLEDHDPSNRESALQKAMETFPFPLGVFYQQDKKTFGENLPVYREERTPLFKRKIKMSALQKYL
jgi:2-oxoglutarate ferredoxin oxidoreductase subunit beta